MKRARAGDLVAAGVLTTCRTFANGVELPGPLATLLSRVQARIHAAPEQAGLSVHAQVGAMAANVIEAGLLVLGLADEQYERELAVAVSRGVAERRDQRREQRRAQKREAAQLAAEQKAAEREREADERRAREAEATAAREGAEREQAERAAADERRKRELEELAAGQVLLGVLAGGPGELDRLLNSPSVAAFDEAEDDADTDESAEGDGQDDDGADDDGAGDGGDDADAEREAVTV